jgi:hypothetical protein
MKYRIQVIQVDKTICYVSNLEFGLTYSLKYSWIFDDINEAKFIKNKLEWNGSKNIVHILIAD